MINYSIIIPFRDKFELLQTAINSIPDREDIQVILIYNGNGEFPKEIIPNKNNLKFCCLISSPNKGAGCARNAGLNHVKGKYILFLDADDYFTPDAFDAFDKYLDCENDITFFKPTSIRLKDKALSNRHADYENKVTKFIQSGNEDELRYRWEGPICKLYNSKYIKAIDAKFDEIRVSNDAWFSLITGHNAKKIAADNAIVYVITEAEEGQSLVKTKTPENISVRFNVAIRINRFLKQHKKYRYRIRLIGFIRIAYKEFGVKEAWKLLTTAMRNKANIC